ncbi:MAG: hypothetical protein WBI07_18230 [Mobilitalea sp.]
MEEQYELKNDILIVAYFMSKNGWNAASKTNFQRILYFAAVLSPTVLPDYEWPYGFANTMYGPVNRDLTSELEELFAKGLLELYDRKIVANRVEEKYCISEQGDNTVKNSIMQLYSEASKILWLETMVKVLSLYEDNFLSKLIKEDPNISYMNNGNQKSKISIENKEDNLSNELLKYLETTGKAKMQLEKPADEEYLMLFFDLLYRKYKGGR